MIERLATALRRLATPGRLRCPECGARGAVGQPGSETRICPTTSCSVETFSATRGGSA